MVMASTRPDQRESSTLYSLCFVILTEHSVPLGFNEPHDLLSRSRIAHHPSRPQRIQHTTLQPHLLLDLRGLQTPLVPQPDRLADVLGRDQRAAGKGAAAEVFRLVLPALRDAVAGLHDHQRGVGGGRGGGEDVLGVLERGWL